MELARYFNFLGFLYKNTFKHKKKKKNTIYITITIDIKN